MIIPGRPDELTPLTVQMLPTPESTDIVSTNYELTSSTSDAIEKLDGHSQIAG